MSSLMPRQTMSCTVKAYHSNPEQLVYSEDPNSGKVRFQIVQQQYQSFPVWVLCIGRIDLGADETGFRA